MSVFTEELILNAEVVGSWFDDIENDCIEVMVENAVIEGHIPDEFSVIAHRNQDDREERLILLSENGTQVERCYRLVDSNRRLNDWRFVYEEKNSNILKMLHRALAEWIVTEDDQDSESYSDYLRYEVTEHTPYSMGDLKNTILDFLEEWDAHVEDNIIELYGFELGYADDSIRNDAFTRVVQSSLSGDWERSLALFQAVINITNPDAD